MSNDLAAFEKIPVKIFNTSEQASVFVANEIAALIRARQKENKPCGAGPCHRIYTYPCVCRISEIA
jgi:glucosamine-6-phosphate deaminase